MSGRETQPRDERYFKQRTGSGLRFSEAFLRPDIGVFIKNLAFYNNFYKFVENICSFVYIRVVRNMKDRNMKLFILSICFITFKTSAQNLNYNDLKIILSKTIVESSDYLEKKEYRVLETNSNKNDNQISYIWDKKGKANPSVSYLLITWDKDKDYKMVWYQFHTLSHFNQIKSSLEQIGFKLTDSYVKFESLFYEYTSSNYSVSMSKGDSGYTFSIKYNWDKVLKKEIIPKY
jgi:hypothetical protein